MNAPPPLDPLALAQALIRCASVTPADAGALGVLEAALAPLGFACHRLRFATGDNPPIENLYAVAGQGGRNFCFAGHTDVVPVGDRAGWSVDPFAAAVSEGVLYGRGAADMKGAIAAFAAAAARFLARRGEGFEGRVSLLVTGDEEGPSIDGTRRVLEWLAERGERLDACVVGEPTNPERLGDMIKIGRRGSLTGRLRVKGVQGHIAYPHLADNPVHRLVAMAAALLAEPLDQGTPHFQPSSLQLYSIDVGNSATNLIPAEARAGFNIRFNDRHTGASLEGWLRRTLDAVGGQYELEIAVSGEAFLTQPGDLSALVAGAVERRLGRRPELSTTGGTSDARFIRSACPVVEFGLVGQTMHKIDERVAVADLAALADIYDTVLEGFFPRMIPSLAETGRSLDGLWRLAQEGAPGLRCFDRSPDGLRRSFGAAILAAPFYALTVALDPPASADLLRTVVVEASGYAMMWLALPLALHPVALQLGRAAEWRDFVIALNWLNALVTALDLLLSLLGLSQLLPGGVLTVVALVYYVGVLAFEWYLARHLLRGGMPAAFAVVGLDFVLSLMIKGAIDGLLGPAPALF